MQTCSILHQVVKLEREVWKAKSILLWCAPYQTTIKGMPTLTECPIKWNDQVLFAHFTRYMHGKGIAIELRYKNGLLCTCATVNLPELKLADHRVALKTYAENEGVEEELKEAGIIGRLLIIYRGKSPFVVFPVYELLKKPDSI